MKSGRRINMKRGLSIIVGFVLLLTSYGCIVAHRDDDYGRGHEYREHEEHRDRGYDRDRDDRRDRDEHRDYDERRY